MKIKVAYYLFRIILLVAASIYIYFISPFSGNIFYLLFFLSLVIAAIIHRYALIINDSRIVYRPLPLFATKKVNIQDIGGIQFHEDQIIITSKDKKTMIIRKYYLQDYKWYPTVDKMKEISGNLKP